MRRIAPLATSGCCSAGVITRTGGNVLTNDSMVSTSTELEPLCKGRDVFSRGLRIHGRGADHEPCGSRRGRALDVLFGHVNGSPACALEPVGIASGCGPGRPAHVDGKGACIVRLGKADQAGEREEITLEAKSTPPLLPRQAETQVQR